MIEVLVLIPKADNDGNVFSAAHDLAFEKFVLSQAGGLSWRGTVSGVWADKGIVYRDTTRTLVVAIVSIVDGGKIGAIADFAKTHYRQEAIYLAYLGLAEIR